MGRDHLATAWAFAPRLVGFVTHENCRQYPKYGNQEANYEPDEEGAALDFADDPSGEAEAERDD